MNMQKVKTAVVGCGAISDIYLTNMIQLFPILEVVCCSARHMESATKQAAKYHIKACTFEEILNDSSIELIINLTPVSSHYSIIKQALLADKHVYTEKVLCETLPQASELLALADSKGLYLGSAPDTFLGASLQEARHAIESGKIGTVTSFSAVANRNLNFLGSMFSFLQEPGSGIGFDYGVYYMTALLSILGPAVRVCGLRCNPRPNRLNINPKSPDYGKEMHFQSESQMYAILELTSGVHGTLHINGDSIMQEQCLFTIYGTEGILYLTDPNGFGGNLRLLREDADGEIVTLPSHFPFSDNSRGVGPADLAFALRNNIPCRTDKKLAFHVMEVFTRIMESSENGSFMSVDSTFTLPGPLKMEEPYFL